MKVYAQSDIGKVRESNQDAFRAGEIGLQTAYAVVCDGMGGVAGGQIAGRLCADTVAERILTGYRKGMSYSSVKNLLMTAIEDANTAVLTRAQTEELPGMGTTVVAALVEAGSAVIAHVGGSRIYRFGENEFKQLTKDHSVVQYLVDTGKITPEMAKTHPDRNIITRAVGVGKYVEVQLDNTELRKGEVLLLCTDGLTGCVEDEEISRIVRETPIEKVCETLVNAANNAGGKDNIPAVLITDGE